LPLKASSDVLKNPIPVFPLPTPSGPSFSRQTARTPTLALHRPRICLPFTRFFHENVALVFNTLNKSSSFGKDIYASPLPPSYTGNLRSSRFETLGALLLILPQVASASGLHDLLSRTRQDCLRFFSTGSRFSLLVFGIVPRICQFLTGPLGG